MPKTKYSCNICRQEYDSFEEAERCEHNHEVAKELEKTLDSKFKVGAIVKECHGERFFKISSMWIKFDENNKPYWIYCVGNDYYLKPIYKKENELELVLTKDQVEEIIKSFDDVLKKHGFDFTSFLDICYEDKEN